MIPTFDREKPIFVFLKTDWLKVCFNFVRKKKTGRIYLEQLIMDIMR